MSMPSEPVAGIVRVSDVQETVAIPNVIATANIPINPTIPVTIQPFDWLDKIKPSWINQKTWSFLKGSSIAVLSAVGGYVAVEFSKGSLNIDMTTATILAGVAFNAFKKYVLDNS